MHFLLFCKIFQPSHADVPLFRCSKVFLRSLDGCNFLLYNNSGSSSSSNSSSIKNLTEEEGEACRLSWAFPPTAAQQMM